MTETKWMGDHKAPIPPNEVERLEALSRYESIELEPLKEENFDNLAELAAEFCDVPIAFIIQKYVSLMGGLLEVQSEVGMGTKFSLKIPLK